MPIDSTPSEAPADAGMEGTSDYDPLEGATDPHAAADPTGAVELGVLRGSRERELADRLAADEAAAQVPMEGFVPGEPGRRYISRLPAANAASDRVKLADVRGEIANDPLTGAAAQARTGKIQSALDDAATFIRPEIGDAAKTAAERNYFAEFMKNKGLKMGEYAAAGSPEAYAAGMTPVRVAGSAESQDVLDAAGRRAVAVARAGRQQNVKYTATEQQMLDSANSVQELGPKLLALLEQQNPGIDKDPGKFGSWTDVLGSKVGGWVYRQGKSKSALSDQIDQLTGYLEAQVPRLMVPGRLNQKMYEDLKLHAPALGLSDGANYERLRNIVTTIIPAVMQGMDEAHGPNPTSVQTPGQDDPWARVPPPDQLPRDPNLVNR
jgi:hypothetical protein